METTVYILKMSLLYRGNRTQRRNWGRGVVKGRNEGNKAIGFES